jgi:hypothetical protein
MRLLVARLPGGVAIAGELDLFEQLTVGANIIPIIALMTSNLIYFHK